MDVSVPASGIFVFWPAALTHYAQMAEQAFQSRRAGFLFSGYGPHLGNYSALPTGFSPGERDFCFLALVIVVTDVAIFVTFQSRRAGFLFSGVLKAVSPKNAVVLGFQSRRAGFLFSGPLFSLLVCHLVTFSFSPGERDFCFLASCPEGSQGNQVRFSPGERDFCFLALYY